MTKILRFDPTDKKPLPTDEHTRRCDHRQVIAYTVYRTVRCAACGTLLDPFDVLVDLFKGYVPPDAADREEKRLLKEVRRRGQKSAKNTTS